MSDRETVTDSISRYAVAGAATDDAFKGLRGVAEQAYHNHHPDERVVEFCKVCADGENEFMEINYGNDPDAKHTAGKRAGQWKYRSFLPAASSSAKSELKKALDEGVDPTGRGKSELAKVRKQNTTVQADPAELATKHFGNAMKQLLALPLGSTLRRDLISKWAVELNNTPC